MSPLPDPALHAARERVVRLLTDRYADETLTIEDFEARLDRLHALATPAALEAMARELAVPARATARVTGAEFGGAGAPDYAGAFRSPDGRDATTATVAALAPRLAPAYAPAQAAGAPGVRVEASPGIAPAGIAPAGVGQADVAPYASGEPRRSLVVMTDRAFRGTCVVPARWELRAVMSSVVLDLRGARFVDSRCHLDLLAFMASVELLVPADVSLELEVGGIMATVAGLERHEATWPAAARLHVGGTALMSSVEVRVADPGMPAELPFRAAWRAAGRQR